MNKKNPGGALKRLETTIPPGLTKLAFLKVVRILDYCKPLGTQSQSKRLP